MFFAFIHFAGGESRKGLQRPTKPRMGGDKDQGVSAPENRGYSDYSLSVGESGSPEIEEDAWEP